MGATFRRLVGHLVLDGHNNLFLVSFRCVVGLLVHVLMLATYVFLTTGPYTQLYLEQFIRALKEFQPSF